MLTIETLTIIAAVFAGNLLTAGFFAAVYVTHKLQKEEGRGKDELPLWVYPCLVLPPASIAAVSFLAL